MSTSDIEKGAKVQTSDEGSVKGSVCETQYREYPYRYILYYYFTFFTLFIYRFVIMALYCGISIGNQILWVACAPIVSNLQKVISNIRTRRYKANYLSLSDIRSFSIHG